MEWSKFISTLLLTTLTTLTFAINNQEMVDLLHQNAKPIQYHKPHTNQNQGQLNWESLHGPKLGTGVHVIQMKDNPSMLFAFRSNVHGVIHKSIDGGQTWKELPTPKNVTIYDLISVNENRLLLGAGKHIYASDDQGEHWEHLAKLKKNCEQLFALNSKVIVLKANTHRSDATVYRSLNGGESWVPAIIGLNMENLFSGKGLTGKNNILLISAGLNVSTNNGASWTLHDKWKKVGAGSIAISSQSEIYFSGPHLYKTDPEGATLEKINFGAFSTIEDIKIDNQDYLYVVSYNSDTKLKTLHLSKDKGKSWEVLKQFSEVYDVTPLDNGKVIVSTDEGLLEFDELSRQFVKLPANFSASETIKVFALDEKHLFAIDGWLWGPLWHSQDGGKTWAINRDGDVRDIHALNNQLVEIEWDKEGNGTRLLTSLDKGKTWQEITSPAKNNCESLMSSSDALFLGCKYEGLFVTRDLSNWKLISKSIMNVHISGKSIYQAYSGSFRKSDDFGETWTTFLPYQFNRFNPLRGYGTTYLTGFEDKVLLAAIVPMGVIKSTDGGTSWDFINDGIEDYYFTDFKALNENHYILTTQHGIYVTRDGGKHWVMENNGLDNVDIRHLFAGNGMLLVGTNGSGVFKALLDK